MSDPEATSPPVPAAPARRATDLPPGSPWWASWLEANISEAWKWASVRFPVAVAAGAELYAADPVGMKAAVQGVVPASWWPHLIALGCFLQVGLRLVNLGKKG